MVYGDSSSPGSTAAMARSAKRAVADLTPAYAGHAADFAHGERREVVVQHETLALFPLEGFQALLIVRGSQGHGNQCLRFAAGKERGAVDTGQHTDFNRDLANLVEAAPVRPYRDLW